MKKVILILCFLFCIVLSLGVSGVSCTSTPVEDCTVDANLQFEADGIFTLNDTNGNGAIIIGANDVTLDCNGSTIKGNFTGSSVGIYQNFKTNVTIKNCTLHKGYSWKKK